MTLTLTPGLERPDVDLELLSPVAHSRPFEDPDPDRVPDQQPETGEGEDSSEEKPK